MNVQHMSRAGPDRQFLTPLCSRPRPGFPDLSTPPFDLSRFHLWLSHQHGRCEALHMTSNEPTDPCASSINVCRISEVCPQRYGTHSHQVEALGVPRIKSPDVGRIPARGVRAQDGCVKPYFCLASSQKYYFGVAQYTRPGNW